MLFFTNIRLFQGNIDKLFNTQKLMLVTKPNIFFVLTKFMFQKQFKSIVRNKNNLKDLILSRRHLNMHFRSKYH